MSIAKAAANRTTLESNIRSYLAGRILLAAGGFISIPLINRAIGVDNYGLISLWTTLACWVPQILAGWLQQSTLRYHKIFDCSDEGHQYRAGTRRVLHCLAGAAVVVTFLALPLLGSMSLADRVLTACLAGSTVWNITFAAVAQAELKPSLVVLSDLARSLVPILLVGAQMTLTGSATRTGTLAFFLTGMVLADAALWLNLRQQDASRSEVNLLSRPAMRSEGRERTFRILRRMFAFGLPMGIWFGLSTGQMLIGRIVLQRYHLNSDLGFFTGFQDFFSKTGTVLFMPITYALHGQVMALWADGEERKARQTIGRAALYQGGLALVMCFAVVFTQNSLMHFLFGGSVHALPANSAALVLVLTVGVVLSNLGLVSHKGMEIGERTAQMAICMGAALGINALLSLVLTPRWNALGVAWGLLAGNLFYLCATYLGSRQALRMGRRGEGEIA